MLPSRFFRIALVTLVVWYGVGLAECQSSGSTTVPMSGFRTAHPRLIITDGDLVAIKRAIGSDSFARSQFTFIQAKGQDMLRTSPMTYKLGGEEHTLLGLARIVEDRILTLGGLYRLTGDRRYADRAIQEMLAAANFPDWNPQHFLDTAEMTAALGIGYDWLYSVLTPAQRDTIRHAVQSKGLAPFLSELPAGKLQFINSSNWGDVCYGGETLGALGIAEPNDAASMASAQQILGYARTGFAQVMQLYSPDGGFDEGPVYWYYATIYNSLYLAALDSALGSDFGQDHAAGFSLTGTFREQSVGPSYQLANFGDADQAPIPAAQMFWMARHFNRPDYAASEKGTQEYIRTAMAKNPFWDSARFDVFCLFWYSLGSHSGTAAGSPLYQTFQRIGQGFIRSSWTDRFAWYVAFKGGDARAVHGHLDLGSFILEGLGERWGVDPGKDSYAIPASRSWRPRTEAHNTLTIGNQNEDANAKAAISPIQKHGDKTFSIINLDDAYKSQLRHWQRGVALLSGGQFLVQDEVQPVSKADVVWHFHTYATVVLSSDARTATLVEAGRSIKIHLLTPSMRFSREFPQTTPPQYPVTGMTDLVIQLPDVTVPTTIAALFSSPTGSGAADVKPLTKW